MTIEGAIETLSYIDHVYIDGVNGLAGFLKPWWIHSMDGDSAQLTMSKIRAFIYDRE